MKATSLSDRFSYHVVNKTLDRNRLEFERGSIRREYLDHFIVLNKRHLCRILTRYLAYYD